jgi:large subunit ribosomal protein L30e
MASITEILRAEKNKKATYGTDKTIKALKRREIVEVVLSSNCPERTKTRIKNLTEISKAKISTSKHNSEELGSACKKPFLVTVIGLTK